MADLEVLYNSECPICSREINHYKKISKNNINFIQFLMKQQNYGL